MLFAPFSCPGSGDFSGQKSALGHRCRRRGFAQVQHRGAGTLGGLGAGEGDVVRRDEQPGAFCSVWLGAGAKGAGCCSRSSLHPQDEGERGLRHAQVSSPALGRGRGDFPAGIHSARAEPHPGNWLCSAPRQQLFG